MKRKYVRRSWVLVAVAVAVVGAMFLICIGTPASIEYVQTSFVYISEEQLLIVNGSSDYKFGLVTTNSETESSTNSIIIKPRRAPYNPFGRFEFNIEIPVTNIHYVELQGKNKEERTILWSSSFEYPVLTLFENGVLESTCTLTNSADMLLCFDLLASGISVDMKETKGELLEDASTYIQLSYSGDTYYFYTSYGAVYIKYPNEDYKSADAALFERLSQLFNF